MSPHTIEHLTELLDAKNNEIERLRNKLDYAESSLRAAERGWAQHVELPGEQILPVPRLEILYEQHPDTSSWHVYFCKYRLVYRHLTGGVIGVPLGETRISGSNGKKPINDDGKIELPFRDGAHIAYDCRTLNLPAFVVLDAVIQQVTPRPDDPNAK